MLNLVIAILGTVYANLNALSNGLLFDELIEVMPEMDWHDQFGCIVCVQLPLQWFYIIILPILQLYDTYYSEKVAKANNFITNVLFFPISIIFTLIFCFLNLILIPFVWIYQIFLLFSLVFD